METLGLIIFAALAGLIGVLCRRQALKWYGWYGGAEARFNLAKRYLDGRGVDRDPAAAAEWFAAAAEAGHLRAPLALGMMHALGDGIDPNPVQAYAWLVFGSRRLPPSFLPEVSEQIEMIESRLDPAGLKAGEKGIVDLCNRMGRGRNPGYLTLMAAADEGSATAQCLIGEKHYQLGEFDQARQWFERAAAGKNADAFFRLGEMYKFGRGAPLDQALANSHLERAAALGHPAAAAARAGTWNVVSAEERKRQLSELQETVLEIREKVRENEEEAERMAVDPEFADQRKREWEARAALIEEVFHLLRAGNLERLKELLDTGRITPDFELNGGDSMLYLASLLGKLEIVQLLLERGADPAIETIPGKLYPLHAACTNPDNPHAVEIARLLIKFHRSRDEVPPDLRNESGMTPLMLAANVNLPKLVELLLAAGANPNAVDALGMTPLHHAIDGRAKAAVHLLLKAGADLGIKTTPEAAFGPETPLESAHRFAPELAGLIESFASSRRTIQ